MSMSPITARVTITNKNIAKCIDEHNPRYAMGAVAVFPVNEVESRKIGTNVDMSPLFETRDKEEVYTVATDGIIMGITRQAGIAAKPVLMPAKIVKPGTKKQPNQVTLNGRWESTLGTVEAEVEGRFPRVADVLPQVTGEYHVVRLNAEKLAKLAAAISTDGEVTLLVKIDNGRTDEVIAVVGDDGIGAICPCCITGKKTEISKVNQDYRNTFNEQRTAFKNAAGGGLDMERFERVKELLNPVTDISDCPVPSNVGYMARVIKFVQDNSGSVCMFARGYDYECFGEDAETMAKRFGLTLSKYECEPGYSVDVVRFPKHHLDIYKSWLESNGMPVAFGEDLPA